MPKITLENGKELTISQESYDEFVKASKEHQIEVYSFYDKTWVPEFRDFKKEIEPTAIEIESMCAGNLFGNTYSVDFKYLLPKENSMWYRPRRVRK